MDSAEMINAIANQAGKEQIVQFSPNARMTVLSMASVTKESVYATKDTREKTAAKKEYLSSARY
jgi:hypothetical protein